MEISKEILGKVFEEMMEELNLSNKSKKIQTFEEIEGQVLKFGKEFERRALEETIEEQRKKAEKKKRHARSVEEK